MNISPDALRFRQRLTASAVLLIQIGVVLIDSPYLRAAWVDALVLAGLVVAWRGGIVDKTLPIAFSTVALIVMAEPSVGFWPAVWGVLIPLFYLIQHTKSLGALFLRGQWIGTLIALGIYSWLWHGMKTFFEEPPLKLLPAWFMIVLFMGVQFSAFCVLTRWLARRMPIALGLVGALVEYWMPVPMPIQLGLAFSWTPPMIQISDLAGMNGVTLSIALVSGLLYTAHLAWRRHRRKWLLYSLGGLIALLTLQIGYGFYRPSEFEPADNARSLDVVMIQPLSPLKIMQQGHRNQDARGRDVGASIAARNRPGPRTARPARLARRGRGVRLSVPSI